MTFNVFPYVVSWAVLACIVLGMAVYKLFLYVRSSRNEFAPHLLADQPQVQQTVRAAHREEVLDNRGKFLTIITLVYGLGIAVIYLYSAL